MSIGMLARRCTTPAVFNRLARLYRRVFLDMDAYLRHFPDLSTTRLLLDIGGGDGVFLNLLLTRYPSLSIVMIDIAADIGRGIESGLRHRVEINARTSIADYCRAGGQRPDCILISDVVHHIPVPDRAGFFKDLHRLVGDARPIIALKEVSPGGWRSALSVFADRWISGDRRTRLLPQQQLVGYVHQAFGELAWRETGLYGEDPPNYLILFEPAPPNGPRVSCGS